MNIKATWIFKLLLKYTRYLNAYFKALQASNVGVLMLFVCTIILFFFVKWACMGVRKRPIYKYVRRGEKPKNVSWRDEQGDGMGLEDIRYI